MKRFFTLVLAAAFVILTASTCDKESYKLYRDTNGNTTSIFGAWGLVEVQYWTAGVVETRAVQTESLMEFFEDGRGRSLRMLPDGTEEEIYPFYYEKYPGSITIFTVEEWKNNRNLSQEDNRYMRGKTYWFKVIDQDTISSKENVSSGSYIVNVFARFQ